MPDNELRRREATLRSHSAICTTIFFLLMLAIASNFILFFLVKSVSFYHLHVCVVLCVVSIIIIIIPL